MEPSTNSTAPLTTTPLPSSAPLAGLSDAELLTATRRLVGRSNQLLASLLAHLAEVEGRGIQRSCLREPLHLLHLRAALFRRRSVPPRQRGSPRAPFSRVARCHCRRRTPPHGPVDAGSPPHPRKSRRGPRARQAPHQEGARASGPAPRPVARGSVPHRAPRARAFAPPLSGTNVEPIRPCAEPHPRTRARRATARLDGLDAQRPFCERRLERNAVGRRRNGGRASAGAVAGAALAEHARVRLEPQRYKVQFEASEEYVELVERAKALLSHRGPGPDLGDLHLRAMRALVAELEREKYAGTTRQRVARRSAVETADEQLHRGEPEHQPEPQDPRRRTRRTVRPTAKRGRRRSSAPARALAGRDRDRARNVDCEARCHARRSMPTR